MSQTYLGMKPDVSPETQAIFDAGHNNEAQSRPLAEEILGESLFPVVGTLGDLSASFDGITFDDSTVWECKSLNAALRDAIPAGPGIHEVKLPEVYCIQMEQQLLVSGAERVLFTAAKWNGDQLMEARHAWYHADLALRERILQGWRQFAADLASYVPPKSAPPKAVGKTMASLPALFVMVEGRVTETNLEPWKKTALDAIRSVNRDLSTDLDFATATNMVKWCSTVEENCDTARAYTLSQTTSIADALQALDDVQAEARKVRLELEKLVTKRKAERKTEIVGDAVTALHTHITELNASLAPYRLPAVTVDFNAATARKSSFDSMQSAVNTELARAKIEASGTALRLRVNITRIADVKEFAFLFNDAADLITKDADAVEAIVQNRIRGHQEAKRAEEEATRARIAAEEKEKAEAAARAQAAEILRQEREAQEARDREAKAEADRQAAADNLRADEEAAAERRRLDEAARLEREKAGADPQKLDQAGAPVVSAVAESIVSSSLETFETPRRRGVIAVPGFPVLAGHGSISEADATVIIDPPEHAWINLGKMAEAFGFRLDAEFVTDTLGEPYARTEKSAKFWTPSAFERIKRKLAAHVLQATPPPF